MTPSSPFSSNASARTQVFEVAFSPLLASVATGFHVGTALLVAWHWQWAPTVVVAAALGALVGSVLTLRLGLVPGGGRMPRFIKVTADGTWCLEGHQRVHGVLHAAWVHPWLCRVVLIPLDGGRRYLWLARDALGGHAHWRLRRLLRGSR